ncbi:hypothetical protein EI94DRAFT_81395 [Lactarius quietus]|nr:hypothetical protein EI94DRAFT_81395 [Lactarius quietus]
MSTTTPTTSSSSSNIDAMIEEALKEYEKSLRPLMDELKGKSTADILAVFRTQVKDFKEFASEDKLMKSLNPIVNVLCASSSVIGAGVALVFSPASVIFAGVDGLLSVAKDVIASHDALIEIFERIGNFFNRLEKHTEKATMEAIKDIIVETMVEVLKIFAFMTKEVKLGKTKRLVKSFFKNLIGSDVIKVALSKLDRLTQEEGNRLIGHTSNTADRIEGDVGAARGELKVVGDEVKVVGDEVKGVSADLKQHIKDGKEREAREDEEKRRQRIEENRRRVREDRKWLSPPDPSTNQNIATNLQHEGTAAWFFKGNISKEWKSKPSTSLLWIHGKPGSGKSILCSAVIQDIMALRGATVAYFYFDFKDVDKQNLHNALPSLLTQLSARSDSYCDILSRVYEAHDNGASKLSNRAMIECLKEMLALPDQGPVYVILDALDECPNTSGIPSAREQVLDFLQDLVGLRLSNLHICVTSRPEVDIKAVLEPLAFHAISIHEQKRTKGRY